MQFSFAILVQCYHQIGLLDQFSFAKRERAERLELSEEARREVLVNALVDRDYFSTAHIQAEIYHNRVQASNPGNLLFDKKCLGKKSVPRNPIGWICCSGLTMWEIGSGIKRVKQTMGSYDLDIDAG